MAADPQKTSFLNRAINGANSLLNDMNNLQALIAEGQIQGFIGVGTAAGSLVDADLQAISTSFTAAKFNAAMTALQLFPAQLAANNNAILAALMGLRK